MSLYTVGDLLAAGATLKTGPFGTTLAAREYSAIGVPLVSVGEIGEGIIEVTDRTPRVPPEVTARLSEYLLEHGDIVFARKGSVDRTAKVRSHEQGYFLGSDGLRLRVGDSADPDFVALQLRSPMARSWLLQHAGGSTLHSLNQETISRVPLRLPPIEEQHAIAEVLGALDDKIASNDAVARSASALGQRLFQKASRRAESAPVSALATPVLGGTPSRSNRSHWRGEVAWASARDVAGAPHGVVLGTQERISREASAKTRAHVVPKGSVLITARGTVGAVARLGVEAAFNQSCYAFLPGALPPAVLYFTVRMAADNALSLAHGSVFSTITTKSFDFLHVPVLSAEQIRRAEAVLDPLLALTTTRLKESHKLAELRDTLLPHLMSGRITVRQAEKTVEEVL